MNKTLAEVVLLSRRLNRQHLQVIFAVIALAMLVVGVGAPSDGGGAGRSMMGMLHHHIK